MLQKPRKSWTCAAVALGLGVFLGDGVSPAAMADQGGDGNDRGDTQRAVVNKSADYHEVIRYGDTPSDNYTFKYNAKYGDAGSYRASELTKVDDGVPYIHESHSRDVVGSGSDKTDYSAHYSNGRTQRP